MSEAEQPPDLEPSDLEPSSGAGEAKERQFPCGQCGASLTFAPGVSQMECTYCGHSTEIEVVGEVVELDYHAMLASLEEQAAGEDHSEVRCDGCGAVLDRPPELDAFDCVYCGQAIVATATSRRRIRPDSVLPFKVVQKEAQEAFRKWVSSRWFAPSALKKRARAAGKMKGVYQPYWTYDCSSTTQYRGERGEHYWETVTVTRQVDGKTVTDTEQVQRTRWYPASGWVHLGHDDVLVPAASSLPSKLQERLEPWDLHALVPYSDDYLAGFVTEGYQMELDEGFDDAKGRMQPRIDQAINRDIGGDEQRIHSKSSSYDEITFKHVLLPLWISSYRYADRSYRFLINARTGEVAGERPWSVWKIVGTILLVVAMIAGAVFAAQALR